MSVSSHLNQAELARRWKLSPRTLERWRWLGQPPRFLKIGGRVAYRLEDIEAFEAEQLREITPRAQEAPFWGRLRQLGCAGFRSVTSRRAAF